MSWSDDTRCLYCEGRLPLYRKITHGQFCSSAHRKSYWQEHERLAVERLHQTHSSLRSYRSIAQAEVQTDNDLELPTYGQYEAEQEPAIVVRLALPPDEESEPDVDLDVDTDLEMDPAHALYANPDLSEAHLPAPDVLFLLSSDLLATAPASPELVAADPVEYEIAGQALTPSPAWTVPGTNPLPEARQIAAWSYVVPQTPSMSARETVRLDRCDEEESEVPVCQPQSQALAVRMGAAGSVGLPLSAALESIRVSAVAESNVQVLDMEPAPMTSVKLEVPLESDVLLELLDQQMPHPDEMFGLHQFAAQAQLLVPACPPLQEFDATSDTTLPAAACSVIAPEYQLSGAEMLRLAVAVAPEQGPVASHASISDLPVAAAAPVTASMPLAQTPAYEIGTAGLQTLRLDRSRPVKGVFALQTTGAVALDLSAGVSSDITFPGFTNGVSAAASPQITADMLPLTFTKKRRAAGDVPRVEPIARLLPQAVETLPMFPQSGLQPLDRKPAEDNLRVSENFLTAWKRGDGLKKFEPAWAHATGFWNHAPRDLKLLLFAIPALLALVFHPGLPRIAFAAPKSNGFGGGFTRVVSQEWGNVRQTLENRAAIALDEDFRSGLDNWVSPGGSTTEWSFDSTGFVRPGPLALYRPSVGLADYQVQFLGTIDKKAMSWVVRAADFENFYVIKLTVVKPGPIPTIGLTRYAVINGKSRDRHDVTIPIPDARVDTNYRVRMDVQGSNFAVEVQGQIADSWTETRLPRGGIGFFTASGEASRLRWVQITHQYDMLGRLCAYLAPYDTSNGSWQP